MRPAGPGCEAANRTPSAPSAMHGLFARHTPPSPSPLANAAPRGRRAGAEAAQAGGHKWRDLAHRRVRSNCSRAERMRRQAAARQRSRRSRRRGPGRWAAQRLGWPAEGRSPRRRLRRRARLRRVRARTDNGPFHTRRSGRRPCFRPARARARRGGGGRGCLARRRRRRAERES